MKTFFSRYASWLVFLLFVILTGGLYHNILSDISVNTYNFDDNISYVAKIDTIGKAIVTSDHPLSDLAHKGIQIVSPLQEIGGGVFSAVSGVSPMATLNIIILLDFVLAGFFMYLLIFYITRNIWIAIFAGVFFGFSSLHIYANWFNLVGIAYIPLLAYMSIRFRESPTRYGAIGVLIAMLLLALSSTYYIIFPAVIWLAIILASRGSWRSYVPYTLLIGVGYIIAGMVYLLPMLVTDSMAAVQTAITSNKFDYYGQEYTNLLFTNTFNPFTHYPYLQYLPQLPYFRYSVYFGFAGCILLMLGIYSYIRSSKAIPARRVQYATFGIVIFVVGLLFFGGDYLQIFGINTHIPLPLRLVHDLPYGWMIRKSAYFFYLIAFGGAILISVALVARPRFATPTFVIIFTMLVFIENVFDYHRPYHKLPDTRTLYENMGTGSYMVLPNTGFMWSTTGMYDSINQPQSTPIYFIDIYHDLAQANGKGYKDGICTLSTIITNKKVICDSSIDRPMIDDLGLRYFVVLKDYVKDFFFQCDVKCQMYVDTIESIEKSGLFVKKYENDSGILYEIRAK